MSLVLLGAPGAGKDTLADQLVEQYNYTMLTPGAIFRAEADKGTELGVWARDTYWGKGQLCPDEVTNKIVRQAFEQTKTNLIIFNGYPRTWEQAYELHLFGNAGLVLSLNVDEDVAVKRLLSRGRVDDSEEVIRERFKVFKANNSEIRDYYSHTSIPVVDIDANKTPKEVFNDAFQSIMKYSFA